MAGLLWFSGWIDLINARIGRAMSWAILAAVIVSSVNASIRYAFNTSSNSWLELQWHLFSAVFLLGAAYTFQKNEHIRIDILNSRLSATTRNVIDVFGHIFFLLPFSGLLLWLGTSNAWRSFSSTGAVTLTQMGFFVSLILLGVLVWALVSYVPSLKRSASTAGRFVPAAVVVGLLFILDIYAFSKLMTAVQPFWEQSSSAGGLPTWPARFLIPLGFLSLFMQGISELIKRIAVIKGLIPDPHASTASAHGSVE